MLVNASVFIENSINGRGGHTPETLPRSKSKKFTISDNHQNSRFRCSNCGIPIPNLTAKEAKSNNACPFCHAKNSLVTILNNKKAGEIERMTKEEVKMSMDMISKLYKKYNGNISGKEISEITGIKYPNVIYYMKKLGISKKTKKNKSDKISVNNEPINKTMEISLSKFGKNLAVKIPKDISESLGWETGDKIEIIKDGDSVLLKKSSR